MGKPLRAAKVKVEGEAGPLGKGVPLTQAIGPGGLRGLFTGKPMAGNMQVPGFKGLIERARAAGKLQKPSAPHSRMFGRALNQKQEIAPGQQWVVRGGTQAPGQKIF